jgi:hypothetical protein
MRFSETIKTQNRSLSMKGNILKVRFLKNSGTDQAQDDSITKKLSP